MSDPAWFQFAAKAWPALLAGAPGAWALWKAYRVSRAEGRKERTDLIQIAQEAAGAVIQDLRDEADRLRERLEHVEAELTELRREHAQMIANKDAKIALLEGERRQLEMRVQSLEALLARNGIPLPKQGELYWEVAMDGGLTPRPALGGVSA